MTRNILLHDFHGLGMGSEHDDTSRNVVLGAAYLLIKCCPGAQYILVTRKGAHSTDIQIQTNIAEALALLPQNSTIRVESEFLVKNPVQSLSSGETSTTRPS